MSSQAFFWIDLILGVLIVTYFLWGRKDREPSRLSLRSVLGRGVKTPAMRPSGSKPDIHFASQDSDVNEPRTKSLNVMFMYNGHSFDAYEVLGIPAGSSKAAAELAFAQQSSTANSEKKIFLETAISAIREG